MNVFINTIFFLFETKFFCTIFAVPCVLSGFKLAFKLFSRR